MTGQFERNTQVCAEHFLGVDLRWLMTAQSHVTVHPLTLIRDSNFAASERL